MPNLVDYHRTKRETEERLTWEINEIYTATYNRGDKEARVELIRELLKRVTNISELLCEFHERQNQLELLARVEELAAKVRRAISFADAKFAVPPPLGSVSPGRDVPTSPVDRMGSFEPILMDITGSEFDPSSPFNPAGGHLSSTNPFQLESEYIPRTQIDQSEFQFQAQQESLVFPTLSVTNPFRSDFDTGFRFDQYSSHSQQNSPIVRGHASVTNPFTPISRDHHQNQLGAHRHAEPVIRAGQNQFTGGTENVAYSESARSAQQSPIRQNQSGPSWHPQQNTWTQYRSPLKDPEIPEFDGDRSSYEAYRYLIQKLIVESPEPEFLKMIRMKKTLGKKPLGHIKSLGAREGEFQIALDILDDEYKKLDRPGDNPVQVLEAWPKLSDTSLEKLKEFRSQVRLAMGKLKSDGLMGEVTGQSGGTLVRLITQKLPSTQVYRYHEYLNEHGLNNCLENFDSWLERKIKIDHASRITLGHVDDLYAKHKSEERPQPKPRRGSENEKLKSRVYATAETPVPPPRAGLPAGVARLYPQTQCKFCQENTHWQLAKCDKFSKLAMSERIKVANEMRFCNVCLRGRHASQDCRQRSSTSCEIAGCEQPHHTLLHVPIPAPRTRTSFSTTSTNSVAQSLRTTTALLESENKSLRVNLVLDDGATNSYLTEDVCKVLKLPAPDSVLNLHAANGEYKQFPTKRHKIKLTSLDGTFETMLNVQSIPHRMTGNYQAKDWTMLRNRYPHLENVPFHKPEEPAYVDLLIGVDHPELHVSLAEVTDPAQSVVAREGPLGFTCVGVTNVNTQKLPATSGAYTSLADIDERIKQSWSLETPKKENCPVRTQAEQQALRIVESSLIETPEGIQIENPWKNGRPKLPDSFKIAEQRFKSLENKFRHHPEIQQNCERTLKEYIESGYIRIVTDRENTKFLLPHFVISRAEAQTTKHRMVFDGAAMVGGTCLNDHLLAGPALQGDLQKILMKFRRYPYAIGCDIKQMYLRILIHPDDRPYFRFLWRSSPSDEWTIYEFSRVVFGSTSSPFLAQFVSQLNAEVNREECPLAAEAVLENCFMDDVLCSFSTEDEAMRLYNQSIALWQNINMTPHKWVTNSPSVKNMIPEELRAQQTTLSITGNPMLKLLGIAWDSEDDVLSVRSKSVTPARIITKRIMTSHVPKTYDPLGLITPVLLEGKLIIQESWIKGLDWDDPFPIQLQNRALAWIQDTTQIESLKFPRPLTCGKPEENAVLVCFVDASSHAYGCAIYLIVTYQDGSRSSQLVTASSKLSPTKTLTIPKLELSGALLGLHHAQKVCDTLKIDLASVEFYSDALNVLHWIRGHSREFKPFVANRVGEIQSLTSPSSWHYVRTDENPADLCTRPTTVGELINNRHWTCGPAWLLTDIWPRENSILGRTRGNQNQCHVDSGRSTPGQSIITNTESNRLDPKNWSGQNYTRYLKITAICLRWKYTESRANGRQIVQRELDRALQTLIARSQTLHWTAELKAIKSEKSVAKTSVLAPMVPFLDENGLLRSLGRLKNATNLSYDEKFPILLPKNDQLTTLIISAYHRKCNHAAGVNYIHSEMSRKYWSQALREQIKVNKKSCHYCKRYRNKAPTALMASLPPGRVGNIKRCFASTSVDLAGPFETSHGRGKSRTKRWIVLFTCMSTRAVNLQLAYALDKDAYLKCWQRFKNRCGTPDEMYSDLGSNFVGARNELKQLHEHHQSTPVPWKLNPAASPHFGGVHESLIKSLKKALPPILTSQVISDEDLETILSNVETFLNARPLTTMSADPQDIAPITPSHFLVGQQNLPSVTETELNEKPPFQLRWSLVQFVSNCVWTRFLKEYVPTLQKRGKWFSTSKQGELLKVGNIVIVVDERTPRAIWPLGKITQLFRGQDNQIRVVELYCNGKFVRRAIERIIPMDIKSL